jgi:hypothetical protein
MVAISKEIYHFSGTTITTIKTASSSIAWTFCCRVKEGLLQTCYMEGMEGIKIIRRLCAGESSRHARLGFSGICP